MWAIRQSPPDLPPPLTPLSPLLGTLSMNTCRENYAYCLTLYSTLYSLEVAISPVCRNAVYRIVDYTAIICMVLYVYVYIETYIIVTTS